MEHLWLQMWTQPRDVIKEVIIQPDKKREWLLAVLFGLALGLEQASLRGLGDSMSYATILILSVFLSPILGFLYWYVVSAIAYWIGLTFEGTSTWEDMKTAVAWAGVPFIMKILLWVPELAFFGEEMFQSTMPSLENPLIYFLFLLLWLVDLVIGVWYVVVLSKSVAEAHGFSAWRGFSSLAIGTMLLFLPFLLLALFFRL